MSRMRGSSIFHARLSPDDLLILSTLAATLSCPLEVGLKGLPQFRIFALDTAQDTIVSRLVYASCPSRCVTFRFVARHCNLLVHWR